VTTHEAILRIDEPRRAEYALGTGVRFGHSALGVEPLRLHLSLFGAVFAFYLLALWLVACGKTRGSAALGVVLGFALVFRVLQVWTPVYLSSDVYRYLWDGRVQLAGVALTAIPPPRRNSRGFAILSCTRTSIDRRWSRCILRPLKESSC
jgi:hypothetical protein